ncbi:hypothetical protein KS4_11820 [Poriferisphaera corsica]|uniref:Uncharacterized protein n=1 Tax=Poriferisphaera corsica TaxID=2528020 RepID=A0A517YSC7_9BACT|nr:DUF6714 family protein [Poriferisphaera corsica]QDU33137.1 hypothetical protein KS4_11820 [Poriferisphaera corsica]
MNKIDTQWLIDQIRQEFKHILLGDGISLHQTDVVDDYLQDDEELMAKAKANDTDTRWWDVSIENIEKQNWGWPFFDIKGYRYYLPAFMTYYLKHAHRHDSDNAIDSMMYILDSDDYYQSYHATFNELQSRCIAMFLWQYCELNNWQDCDQAKNALVNYWDRFLSWCDNETDFQGDKEYGDGDTKNHKFAEPWLLKEIRAAFDKVRLEDGETIHQADTEGGVGLTKEQFKTLRKNDPEEFWWDIPLERFHAFSSIWSFLDPKGFRFYLPACMSAIITDPHRCIHEEWLIYALENISHYKQHPSFLTSDRVDILDDKQKRVVALFLWQYTLANNWQGDMQEEVSNALENYWFQFIQNEV